MYKNNEARKHHFIPQFIIRNFYNEDGQVYFWDYIQKKLEKRSSRSLFVETDMYRDEKQHSDNPTLIESNLALFEKEIAELISKKILEKDKIILTNEEYESLRIFITLLSFRAKYRKEQFTEKDFSADTVNFLKLYQSDGDFETLWKREIEAISKCRTISQIENSNIINPATKNEFKNDYEGYFMSFLDARGGEFVLTDVYPTFEVVELDGGGIMPIHILVPLSPTRMLILSHLCFLPIPSQLNIIKNIDSYTRIDKSLTKPPVENVANGEITFTLRKCYENDILWLNGLYLNEVREALVFRDPQKILNSIRYYNLHKDNNDYDDLLNELTEKHHASF